MEGPHVVFPGLRAFERTDRHIHLDFGRPQQVLSSAVLNGGLQDVRHIVNLRVPKHSDCPAPPAAALTEYCTAAGWHGPALGLMTAASMNSLRVAEDTTAGVSTFVSVTSGMANARRVADPADVRTFNADEPPPGTINIIAATTARLTPAALVEALVIITEAKCAVLQDLGIKSRVSDAVATGTGTDATAIVNGAGPPTVAYCGKHVLAGEIFGRLTLAAVKSSVDWQG